MQTKHFLLYFGRVLTACLTVAGLAASEHHGLVKSGGLPLPGATVSATQGDKKFVTTTDDQGTYTFADLPDGVWTIQVELFGFSKLSREVGIAPEAPSPTWELPILSLNAVREELTAAPKPAVAAAGTPPTPAVATTANSQQPTPAAANPPQATADGQRPNRGGGGRGGNGNGPGPGNRPSIRQAVAQNGQNGQNGFQRLDVNASADATLLADNAGSGGLGDGQALSDLNQSASDSFVVNGSVSNGLGLPQQNDWFAFGRGFDGGFGGPGGPAGFNGGNQFGGPDAAAQGGAPAGPGGANAGPGGPGGGGGFGGGGGRGGRGGGGGGLGGPGFGGGRGGRGGRGRGFANQNAFGNGRRNRRAQYNGNLALILGNSALDARSFSLTGQDTPKPNFAQFRTTASFGGPLKIPHLISGQKTTFTINFQLARNRNGSVQTLLMPTAAERIGDFSQALNPQTGLPINLTGFGIANNIIPQSQISPQAQALLAYYPLPNFTGSNRYNYQVPLIGIGNQNNVNVRLSHTINAKNQVSGNFAYQNSDTTNPNPFGYKDSTTMTGINSALQYTYHFTTRLISNLRYNFSRQATDALPYFANLTNVSGAAGIQGNDQAAAFWGPPSLSFASGFAGLNDGARQTNHNTTNQIGDSLIWVRGAHNVTFGVDYRRLDFNQFAQQNARGSFNFTSAYTGFDFADFLVGLPGTSSIAYGNADKYFRESWLDAFVNDDWRLNSKLSLQLGLRWDYQGPVNELYNRLVNLAVGQGFTSITPVCGTIASGCTTASAAGYPNSLSRPNYREFQPRIGLAWRPFKKDSTVVRAGYGLYYNTSVYQALATQMAQQSPLSYSVTQPNSVTNPYTLANAFLTPAINSTPQTFGLDPNFQIGSLHYWQLSIQHNLPSAFVATVTYNGDKGTHQVQEFLPNTFPSGSITSPYPVGYVYESSGANSNYNAVTGQLQRRFRSGISGNIVYTFSKAIDDAQGVGGRGGGSAYAQNWLDLAGERSVSSFNRTHTLNLQMQWSTGQGASGGGLLTGWKGVLFKGWTFTNTLALGSGLPETPVVLNRVATGTGITGTVRAEYLGGSLAAIAPGYGFNSAAFGPAPAGQWGNAGRNIITGPAQFTLNSGMGRNFRLGERRNLDLRFDSNNVLNHVTYTSWNTTFGSAQFGLPVSASAMRTLTANLRFRF